MNWDKLYPAAYAHFGCEYLSPHICAARNIGEKQLRQRHKEQSEIWNELKILERICDSGALPQKAALIELRRQKAVEGLSPIMAWITWQIVKTLAIKVIVWLWDQHAEQQTGERRGG